MWRNLVKSAMAVTLFWASGICFGVQYGTNTEVPYYVRAGIERVRAFKQGGNGCGIVIISEVNQPKCFDNKKIYYIPNPPVIIEGNNTKVYIPSDTLIVSEYAPNNNSIVVRNGAKVITGISGEQSNCFGSYPPVWIVTVNDVPFRHNLRGILLEDSASPESWLNNVFVENCKTAIETRPLDYGVANIYANYCYKGIVYHGTGTVTNCQVTNFGKMADGILPYEGRGIEFVMTSVDGSVTYEGAQYEATFNVVHNGDIGITARGSDSYSAQLNAQNNAVTKCSRFAYDNTPYSSIYFTTGGFWSNAADYNDYVYLESPVYETSNPYDFVIGDYRTYLKPTSRFANYRNDYYYQNAYDFSQPGWSTSVDGSPDSNWTDIWVHHQSKQWSPTADLDNSGIVDYADVWEFCRNWLAMESAADYDHNGFIDYRDLYILAAYWLENDPNLDLAGDSRLNFLDFAAMCNWWGVKDPRFADLTGDKVVNFCDYAKITSSLNQLKPTLLLTNIEGNDIDRTSVSGLIFIDFSNFDTNTYAIAIYLDNMLLDKYVALSWYPLELPTYAFSNGRHTLQCVTYDVNNNGTIHRPVEVDFNNSIYYLALNDRFYPGENFPVLGFTDLNTVEVKVVAENDAILWSQSVPGPGYVEANIPGSVFNNQQTCTISITSSSSSTITKAGVAKAFKKTDYPADDPSYKMAIISPNKDITKIKREVIDAVRQACQNKGFKCVELYYNDVNAENLIYVLNPNQMPFIKYVYWTGHANCFADSARAIPRTNLWIWKQLDNGKFKKRNAYSYTTWSESGARPLPGNEDQEGLDLRSPLFAMKDSDKKKIVFIDGCYSAYYDDMARTFGAYSPHNCPDGWNNQDQIYIGWTNEPTYNFFWAMYEDYNGAIKMFWDRMGSNFENTVQGAFDYTISNGTNRIKRALWDANDMSIDSYDCIPQKPLPPRPDICHLPNCCNDHIRWHGCGNIVYIKLE